MIKNVLPFYCADISKTLQLYKMEDAVEYFTSLIYSLSKCAGFKFMDIFSFNMQTESKLSYVNCECVLSALIFCGN